MLLLPNRSKFHCKKESKSKTLIYMSITEQLNILPHYNISGSKPSEIYIHQN